MPRILIADDEPALLEMLKFSLEADGYSVESVTDGKKALEAFRRENYDLVILDVMMPHLDGYHASSEISQNPKSPPVLLMTSREYDQDQAAIKGSGASAFLSKPFEIPEFLNVVRRLIVD